MNTKHTPGPWKHDAQFDTVSSHHPDHKFSLICKLATGEDRAEEDANADLIAASPDLLAALEAIDKASCNSHCMSLDGQKQFERNPEADKYRMELARVIIELRALAREAIAKAKGE